MAKKQAEIDGGLFDIGADEVDEVLAGLPSDDAVINLYRVNPIGRSAYVAEFSPSEFSLDAVRNTYGGGKFKYVAKSNGEVRRGTFEIDGEPLRDGKPLIQKVYKRYVNGRLEFSKPENADTLVTNSPQVVTQNNDVNSLLLLELRQLREALQKPIQAQSPDEIKKGFLEEMLVFKQLFGSDHKDPVADFPKIAIDLIQKGMEVASIAESGGSPWMMILDKVLPTVQDALKAFGAAQQRGVRPPIAAHPVTREENTMIGIQSPSSPVPPMLSGFDAVAKDLALYLPTFISSASRNSDPSLLVDLAAPQIPPDKIPVVVQWLESESCFSDLCTLHPAIAAQSAWWQEFCGGLLEILKNPAQSEAEHEQNE